MTLEDLDQSLPNGLHDARINTIARDFEEANVKLGVEILFGLPDDPPADRYRYRKGEILFNRVQFCTVELPENEKIIGHPGSIWFKFWRTKPEDLPPNIGRFLSPEVLLYSLYILEWESQIRNAAGDVSFSWSDSDGAPAVD